MKRAVKIFLIKMNEELSKRKRNPLAYLLSVFKPPVKKAKQNFCKYEKAPLILVVDFTPLMR